MMFESKVANRQGTLIMEKRQTDYLPDYVKQYATNIHEQSDEEDKESDGELSEVEDYNTDGEDEPAGAMDDV